MLLEKKYGVDAQAKTIVSIALFPALTSYMLMHLEHNVIIVMLMLYL